VHLVCAPEAANRPRCSRFRGSPFLTGGFRPRQNQNQQPRRRRTGYETLNTNHGAAAESTGTGPRHPVRAICHCFPLSPRGGQERTRAVGSAPESVNSDLKLVNSDLELANSDPELVNSDLKLVNFDPELTGSGLSVSTGDPPVPAAGPAPVNAKPSAAPVRPAGVEGAPRAVWSGVLIEAD
jgi:hypothetical protein